MKKKRTVKDIENEMTELRPEKDLAYEDYRDNSGDKETGTRLFGEFRVLRDKWNSLVAERKKIMEGKD